MVKKFRKKPVVIEAIQFTGTAENLAALSEFTYGSTQRPLRYDPNKNTLVIETLEGDIIQLICFGYQPMQTKEGQPVEQGAGSLVW